MRLRAGEGIGSCVASSAVRTLCVALRGAPTWGQSVREDVAVERKHVTSFIYSNPDRRPCRKSYFFASSAVSEGCKWRKSGRTNHRLPLLEQLEEGLPPGSILRETHPYPSSRRQSGWDLWKAFGSNKQMMALAFSTESAHLQAWLRLLGISKALSRQTGFSAAHG